jgi:hypothetical protein
VPLRDFTKGGDPMTEKTVRLTSLSRSSG